MSDIPAKRNPNRCPSHPGALLREIVLPATGRTKIVIANPLGISRQHLYDILREAKPVSAAVWHRMQAAHDIWHAELEIDLRAIPTIGVA
jgi:antitoxin HigA-1